MKKQVRVYYTGRVQGVGFRFTTEEIASDLGILGWVKNLADARVELIAESDEETLKDFLERINHHFSGYIKDVTVEWQQATGEFKEFGIRF